MKNWMIRAATLDDAAGLRACMESAYASYIERMNGASLPPMDADYSSEIAEYPSWVAELDGDIVAGLIMTFENKVATISNIAVSPQAQGLGLGRKLLDFAQNEAKSRVPDHAPGNFTENVSLYEHLGWKITDRDQVRVYMEKPV
jgi:ribosomal protein S18 acetylase RimI-like enzyme